MVQVGKCKMEQLSNIQIEFYSHSKQQETGPILFANDATDDSPKSWGIPVTMDLNTKIPKLWVMVEWLGWLGGTPMTLETSISRKSGWRLRRLTTSQDPKKGCWWPRSAIFTQTAGDVSAFTRNGQFFWLMVNQASIICCYMHVDWSPGPLVFTEK